MTRRRLIRQFTLLLLVTLPAGMAPAQEDGLQAARAFEAALISAIEQAERSVVSVERVTEVAGAGEADTARLSGDFGSGVIIARDAAAAERFVLTAAHVVLGERVLTPQSAEDLQSRPVTIRVHLPSRAIRTRLRATVRPVAPWASSATSPGGRGPLAAT